MPLSNQIVGFSDPQYFWKEINQYLNEFLDRGSHQRKVASETVSFSLILPDVPSQTQICLDLPVLPCGRFEADGHSKNSSE